MSCEDTVDAVSLCSDSGDAVDALGCEDTVDALSRCSDSGDTVVAFSLEDTVDALSLAASAKFKAQQTTPRSLGPFCNKVAFNRQRNSTDSQKLSARSRRKNSANLCSRSEVTVDAFSLEDTVDALSKSSAHGLEEKLSGSPQRERSHRRCLQPRRHRRRPQQKLSARSRRRKTQRTSAAGAKSP